MATSGSTHPFVLVLDTENGDKDNKGGKTITCSTSFDMRFKHYRMKLLTGCVIKSTAGGIQQMEVMVEGLDQYGCTSEGFKSTTVGFAGANNNYIINPGFECVVTTPDFARITVRIINLLSPLVFENTTDTKLVFLMTPIIED